MGLKTDQIGEILQLKGLGKKTVFKICGLAKEKILDTDNDYQ